MKRNWFTSAAVIVSLTIGSLTCQAGNKGFSFGGVTHGSNISTSRGSSNSGSNFNRQASAPKVFQQSSNNFSNNMTKNLGNVRNSLPTNSLPKNTISRIGSNTGVIGNHGQLNGLSKMSKTPITIGNIGNISKNTLPIKQIAGGGIAGNIGNIVGNNGKSPINIGGISKNTLPIKQIGNLGISGNFGSGKSVTISCKPICQPSNNNHNCWTNWSGCYKPCKPICYCPPKYCGPTYVFPVCTTPVIVEVPVPVEMEAPATQVPMGSTLTLQDPNLGEEAGQVLVQVDKISFPAQVDAWGAGSVTTTLPMLDLSAPTRAQLWLVRADGQVANSMTIELVPNVTVQSAAPSEVSAEALSLLQ